MLTCQDIASKSATSCQRVGCVAVMKFRKRYETITDTVDFFPRQLVTGKLRGSWCNGFWPYSRSFSDKNTYGTIRDTRTDRIRQNIENKLTSIRPGPPAVTQSDPACAFDQFRQRQSDSRVINLQWGEITAVTQTPVPRLVPRHNLVAVEYKARSAVVEVILSVLALRRSLYVAICPSDPSTSTSQVKLPLVKTSDNRMSFTNRSNEN